MDLLRVEHLTTTFATSSGRFRAVDDVSLSIAGGRTLCLVGESGCGKSATARSIMRLIDPPGRIESRSQILFEGVDLLALSEEEVRLIRGRDIGIVFQEPMASLNPVYTVGEQVAETIGAHMRLSRRAIRDRVLELFTLVGIPAPHRRVHQYPHELSGGTQQRVMIAMALACSPKLLIADEPTTALDVTIQAQILELLQDLRAHLHMSILLITHDLGTVAEMADAVAVMYAGRVVELGMVDDVFRNPQHPYTEALLHSIPRLGMTQDQRLRVIRGMVPGPNEWPRGCRFAPRCDLAMERCWHEEPLLLPAGSQQSACWLCEGGARRSQGVIAGAEP